jgi:hypothetical protein
LGLESFVWLLQQNFVARSASVRWKYKYLCYLIGFVCDFIDFVCEFFVKTTEHTVASYNMKAVISQENF